MQETLIVVGASARAAAQSAIRAGYRVWAADLFADADLSACATAVRIDNYPRGLRRAFASAPPGDWLYTGALENHPRLVDRLARACRLLGCPGSVLRNVRDPRRLGDALGAAGLLFPETRFDGFPPGEAGRWLTKPLRSAGGARVRFAHAGDLHRSNARDGRSTIDDRVRGRRRAVCFQRFVEGAPCSAAFVADGARSALLGATRQLVGCSWTGARGFQYCGSIGPLELSDVQRRSIEQIGRCLAEQFELRGLFGVDFLLAGDEVWTLEVNPRYTASVEVLERASGASALAAHVAACRNLPLPGVAPASARRCVGKAIVFARSRLVISAEWTASWLDSCRGRRLPPAADVPNAGAVIEQGQPVLTVLAEAATPEALEQELLAQATAAHALLADHAQAGRRFRRHGESTGRQVSDLS